MKASRMRRSNVEPEWRHRQQVLDDDEKIREKYVELFQNKAAIQVVKEFPGHAGKSSDNVGELVGFLFDQIAWMHGWQL